MIIDGAVSWELEKIDLARYGRIDIELNSFSLEGRTFTLHASIAEESGDCEVLAELWQFWVRVDDGVKIFELPLAYPGLEISRNECNLRIWPHADAYLNDVPTEIFLLVLSALDGLLEANWSTLLCLCSRRVWQRAIMNSFLDPELGALSKEHELYLSVPYFLHFCGAGDRLVTQLAVSLFLNATFNLHESLWGTPDEYLKAAQAALIH